MSDNNVLELLHRIDQKLDRLERRIDTVEKVVSIEVMNSLSIFGDTIDESFDPGLESGRKNLANIDRVMSILKKLSKEETISSVEILVDNLSGISHLISQFKQAEDILSILMDSFDDFFTYAMKEGLDIEDFARNLKKFSFMMLDAFESGALTDLMESGILDPSAIKTVGALGKSMATSGKLKNSAGPGKVIASLFDNDIQRALGFLLTFATHFGRTLEEQSKTKRIEIKGDIYE